LLVHLKVIRLFVESVLRYGLPSVYTGIAIKPDNKSARKSFQYLNTRLNYLAPRLNASKKSQAKDVSAPDSGNSDLGGEYQHIMEQEIYDFVLLELSLFI